MTKKERSLLEAKSGIGKPVVFKIKGKSGKTEWGKVVDEVSVIVNDYKHLIQQIELGPALKKPDSSDHKFAYRTAYYTLAAKSRKPVWGQYATLLFEEDYQRLAHLAHEKGWFGLRKA
jgi:hypothetical protein